MATVGRKTLHNQCWKIVLEVSYTGDGLEMAGSSVVTVEERFCTSLLRLPKTELFKLAEINFEDGLDVTGHSMVTLGNKLHGHC